MWLHNAKLRYEQFDRLRPSNRADTKHTKWGVAVIINGSSKIQSLD